MSDEKTLSMDEHWPVEEELELADKACNQIEQILDRLVQDTACSNHAIRDLLNTMSADWSDDDQEMIWEMAIRSQHLEAS